MGASSRIQRSLRAGQCIFGRVALPAESVEEEEDVARMPGNYSCA